MSGINSSIIELCLARDNSKNWSLLLSMLDPTERERVLRLLRKLSEWTNAGTIVRISPPSVQGGLMHAKLYLGDNVALIGSANFTIQGVELIDQQEVLVEIAGEDIAPIEAWWNTQWMRAWPLSKEPRSNLNDHELSDKRADLMATGPQMPLGPQMLLGHWLGEWGAWALNGAGVVSYPHQLQAVEWIRPDGKAYLLGDEVGLGKTFTAALLWIRHRQLHGDKARLLYITKPSLIIDAISAFVDVLGVDEFLEPTKNPPASARDLVLRFTIFHSGTTCWEMLPDAQGRKRKGHPSVGKLIDEGRYRVRPAAFLERIGCLSVREATKLHDDAIESTAAGSIFSQRSDSWLEIARCFA